MDTNSSSTGRPLLTAHPGDTGDAHEPSPLPLVEAWRGRHGDACSLTPGRRYIDDRRSSVAHIAQACGGTVVPLIAADRLTDDALVVVVQEFLRHEGGEPGDSMHGWRCEHPDRYGPCTCLADVSRQLLAALRTHLESA